jgi:group I intron endonuclease
MGIIYIIRNLINNKSYIGQTKTSLNKRWSGHLSSYKQYCNNSKHGSSWALYGAMRKYSLYNLVINKLLVCNDDELDEYEIKYIKIFNSVVPNGYNIRTGGSNGKHCEESREKMRQAKLGSKNYNYGKSRSDEFKAIMKIKKSKENHHFWGKELSIEHKEKLAQSHKKGKGIGLQMYIAYIKARPKHYQSEGYIVTYPGYKKHFTSKKFTLSQKLQMATEYLKSIDT